MIWLDSFAIPADAPHPENAHAFINFMLRPDIAARNSNYVFYANGNKASQELLDAAGVRGVRGEAAANCAARRTQGTPASAPAAETPPSRRSPPERQNGLRTAGPPGRY